MQKTQAGTSFPFGPRTIPGGQSASVVGGLTGSTGLKTSGFRGDPWPRWGGVRGAGGAGGLTWWPEGGGIGRLRILSIEKGRAFGLVSLSDEI